MLCVTLLAVLAASETIRINPMPPNTGEDHFDPNACMHIISLLCANEV